MGDLFGTNGVRGVVGERMTPELALRIGQSVGTTLEPGDAVLVGRDTRTSGPALEAALVSGLLSTGVAVDRAGVVPTPALQLAVKRGSYRRGVVVSASHNPPEFNGIKVVDHDGSELDRDKEHLVEEVYFQEAFRTASWDVLRTPGELPGVNEAYVEGVMEHVDVDAIREAGLRVIVDGSNGAGSLTTPVLLRRLGCDVVTLNCQPDGTFPGHESEPTPENVRDLVTSVTALGCDLGVVVDGDADRAVFVTEEGTYLPGEMTLNLVAGHVVRERGGGTVVTPVSSSSALEEHVEALGGEVEYTAVGSPVVAARMQEMEDAVFGGEENGGLMFPEHLHVRDGGMSVAKVLEILALEGRPLSELVAELPRKALVKLKTACREDVKDDVIAAYAARDREEETMTLDGVKVLKDAGWVLVRPSGTEPIVRVYAEADDEEVARGMAEEELAVVQGIVDELSAK